MIDYVQNLWKNPSTENLARIEYEMLRANEIIVNYHYLLTQIARNDSKNETPKIIRIREHIIQEEELIVECREVAKRIEEALKAKK